jgi:uncharacterized repeat protein (TIGR01451 family)
MSAGITGPASATSGSTVVYTVTAFNLGPAAASQVTATLTLPPGASFVSAPERRHVRQRGGDLERGDHRTGSHSSLKVSIILTTTGANSLTASVQAANPDPNTTNNTTTFTTTVK